MKLLTKCEEGQTLSIVHNFTWKLLKNMTDRFPHIPDFAWISHALPLKNERYFSQYVTKYYKP